MKLSKIVYIILFLLGIISMYIILFLSDFDILKIPSLMSLFIWTVTILSKITPKYTSRAIIFTKGFILNTEVEITCKLEGFNKNFDDIIIQITSKLENIYTIQSKVKMSNTQYFYKISKNNEFFIEFDIKAAFNQDSELKSIYITFEKMQNRHSAILTYGKRVNSIIRNIEGIGELSNSDVIINYLNGENPIIKELLRIPNANGFMYTSDTYKITRNQIYLKCKSIDLVEEFSKVLTGNL